jgi:hypothetical protein
MKMTLQDWANNGWLRTHKTGKQEIRQLLEIAERDLKDAQQKGISADWRFGIAYNAALKLCTILVYSAGYRPEKTLAHYRTLQALPNPALLEIAEECYCKANCVRVSKSETSTQKT